MNALKNIGFIIMGIIALPFVLALGVLKLLILGYTYIIPEPDKYWKITKVLDKILGEIAWFE